MTLTIAIEGKGVIANADGYTDTATTGSTWNEDGAGTDSFSPDTYLYAGASPNPLSFAGAYSNKSGFQYFDIGTTVTALDFDTGGAEVGQFIYMWVHCPTLGLIDTLANKGLAIRLGTSLSDYREYIIAGSDDTNGWNGEWKCFVIDPTKAGSVTDTGTYDCGSIRYMGVWIDTTAIAKGDNIFISQIAVGKGLRITGTSTTGWKDVVDYCTDYANRAWGVFTEKEGIYFAQGKVNIGPGTSANVSFKDSGRILKWAKTEYYHGGAWKTLADINYSGLNIEDAAGYTTVFEDGVIVGTDNGRSGSQFIGNSILAVSVDLYGGNNAASTTKLYNTAFKELTGSIVMGNDADHLFYGGTVNKSKQFDPVGAPKIRNCTFAETVDTDAAVLWNANIDVEDCSFIANTTGAAYEYPNQGTFDNKGLTYSGNTYDLLYSAAASSGVLTINATDSNPSTSEITNPTGNSVSIVNSVPLKVYVKDVDNNIVSGAQVGIYKSSDDSELMNEATAAVTGLAEDAFDYTADTPIYIRIRKSPGYGLTAVRYYPIHTTGTIGSDGFTLTAVLIEDNIAVPPTIYRGWFGGGYPGYGAIDRITLADDTTNASDRCDLSEDRYRLAAFADNTYGWFGGGDPGGTSNVVDRITLADDTTNAIDRCDLSVARQQLAAFADNTYGWFGGGSTSNIVDRITLADDTTNAIDRCDLSAMRQYLAGFTDNTYGWFGGGTPSAVVDRITLATDTVNAIFRCNLSQARWGLAGFTDNTHGWFGGGTTGSHSNVVDRITLATDTVNAIDRCDLTVAREGLAAFTNT